MKHLIEVIKTTTAFDEYIPDACKESLFTTTFGKECKHYYYLINCSEKKIISWCIDLKPVVDQIIERIKEINIQEIPRNLKSMNDYIYTLFVPHSAEYWSGKVYISFTNGSFFLVLDIDKDDYEIIYDESAPMKIYASTNKIYNNYIYFTRYELSDTFERYKNHDYFVKWELGKYNLVEKKFEIFDTIEGTSDVHTATITEDGKNMLFLEMCKDPKMKYPVDYFQSTDIVIKKQILQSRLINSHLIRYNLENRNVETISVSDCPAHIEFDRTDSNIFYIVRHNNSTIEGKVLCFGNSFVDKYIIVNNECTYVGTCTDDDFYRTPSHEIMKYHERQFVLCPSYPDQVFMVDAENMEMYQKIRVKNSGYKVNNEFGAFVYPPGSQDNTPYTVHGVDNSEYLYMTNIKTFMIYDFIAKQPVAEIKYNFNNYPITGTGHSKCFIHEIDG